MNCMLPLLDADREPFRHESVLWFDSECTPGVRYAISRVSLGRRIELARRIREIGRKAEFLAASSNTRDQLEAAVISAEIDREYIEWGLSAVEGLTIDGEMATSRTVIERGPFQLAIEILAHIKHECQLDEAERKN